jgi:hypothetical protein
MRELSEVMRPFTTGSDYVNQIGLETDAGSERIKAAYGANYERLVAVKDKYDPTRTSGRRFRGSSTCRGGAQNTQRFRFLWRLSVPSLSVGKGWLELVYALN